MSARQDRLRRQRRHVERRRAKRAVRTLVKLGADPETVTWEAGAALDPIKGMRLDYIVIDDVLDTAASPVRFKVSGGGP